MKMMNGGTGITSTSAAGPAEAGPSGITKEVNLFELCSK